jgi:hypothetical protein
MSGAEESILARAPFGGPQLGILDTNTIFNDLVYQLRRGREEGAMVSSARAGAVRLFASAHVYEEVYERAPTQERRGICPAELIGLFERRYLPQIRFVDVEGLPSGARALAVEDADPDDLPTARLALALAPCHVYTDDPDLTEAGFGTERNWLRLIRSSERAMHVDQTALITAELAKWGWRKLAPWLERRLRETGPMDVVLGAAIGVLILSVVPAGGMARLERSIDAGGRFLAGAGELGASAGLGLLGERARQTGYLSEHLVAGEPSPTEEARLARELASSGPLGLEELAATLARPAADLHAMLVRLPCFSAGPSGWQVGRRLLPR